MPFDGTISTTALNRARLIEALRNVPQDHAWDFGSVYMEVRSNDLYSCGTAGCAIGIGKKIGLWGSIEGIVGTVIKKTVAPALGYNSDLLEDILCPPTLYFNKGEIAAGPFTGLRYRQVTAAMVADALEALAE